MAKTGVLSGIVNFITGGNRNLEIVEKTLNTLNPDKLAEQIKAASASLVNPDMRVELPADFPPILGGGDGKALVKTLRAELEKRGTTLEEVGHINIAYPHKHPGLFPNYSNNASGILKDVKERLEAAAPGIGWLPVDGLVERVKLGRSEDQSSVHALAAQQVYDINPPDQKTPLPFGANDDGKKEFFIIVDTGAEQGTTYANLISYIRYNGGTVLGAVNGGGWGGDQQLKQVAPKDDAELRVQAGLKPEFNDTARNTGQLARMALAFAKSAKDSGKNWTPAQSLETFEEKLQAVGNSVFALTDGEAERLVRTVNGSYYNKASFVEILDQLDKKIETRKAEVEAKKPVPKPVPALMQMG